MGTEFSIGGVDTLRGYRQNQFVADNGFTASAEMRFPLINQPHGFGTMQISPFVDVGKVWNNNNIQVDDQVFASTGLGLRWQYTKKFSGRLDWGIPLTPIKKEGDSLQDNGIYFSLNYQLF
jgi:hemolysin activation/secretion protein